MKSLEVGFLLIFGIQKYIYGLLKCDRYNKGKKTPNNYKYVSTPDQHPSSYESVKVSSQVLFFVYLLIFSQIQSLSSIFLALL